MYDFKETHAYKELIIFTRQIDMSIKDHEQKENVKLVNIISELHTILDGVRLLTTPQRYGNTVFRTFYQKISAKIELVMHKNDIFIEDELYKKYLTESFGNNSRIDYGTGHELNFLCFIYVLYKNNIVEIDQCFPAMASYFNLAREVIFKYNLEPAGSHGVWGIDDYQILPYLFGPSELFGSELKFDDLFGADNRRFEFAKSIAFVEKHKCRMQWAPFELHSPMLYKMRSKSWLDVNFELMKVFDDDVLGSTAVTQHFIFTNYLSK